MGKGQVGEKGLRAIPSVEKVLQALGETGMARPIVVALVRRELEGLRQSGSGRVPGFEEVMQSVRALIRREVQSRLQPVINGTGILAHTNLGRAPLGPKALELLGAVGGQYSNLEYDLVRGERGSRAGYVESSLALLCGAEAVLVVNNCAAALVLILRHFCRERPEVLISRGELIQIGGGFRIPEILEASGAVLREVGTTNKTSLEDYTKAIDSRTGMILRVHRSNFFMEGFVASPAPAELVALAVDRGIPLVEDLGSGAMVATEKLAAVEHERTPAEVLRGGTPLVCFSGDKLMGGPQAGIIAGKGEWVQGLRREPFFRALRCDKLILAALQATADAYLEGEEAEEIPVLSMLGVPRAVLRARAEAMVSAVEGLPVGARVGEADAQVGAGTLPRSKLASVTLELRPADVRLEDWAARMREGAPPVIGYIANGVYRLDLRTILPAQDAVVMRRIRESAAMGGAAGA